MAFEANCGHKSAQCMMGALTYICMQRLQRTWIQSTRALIVLPHTLRRGRNLTRCATHTHTCWPPTASGVVAECVLFLRNDRSTPSHRSITHTCAGHDKWLRARLPVARVHIWLLAQTIASSGSGSGSSSNRTRLREKPSADNFCPVSGRMNAHCGCLQAFATANSFDK